VTRGQAARIAVALLALTIVGATVAAVVVLTTGRLGPTDGRVVATTVAVFLCGAAAVAAYGLIERRVLRPLAWLALLAVPPELAALLLGVWTFVDEGENPYLRWLPTGLAWIVASLVVTTLRLALRDPRLARALPPAVTATAVAGAGLATTLVWTGADDASWRALASLAAVTFGAWLFGPLADRVVRQG
jgi:hypothetical protein